MTPTGRRLPRAERREQILDAATTAFARQGYTATSLEDIASEAAVTRVILYRHFESKADLYRAVLDRACSRLAAGIGEQPGAYTEAAVDAFVGYAMREPAAFRLLFQHAAREPEFREQMDRFRDGMTDVAYSQISAMVPDPAWARWAARLAATVAVEAVLGWLDAGGPEPEKAPGFVRAAISGVIEAARDPDSS